VIFSDIGRDSYLACEEEIMEIIDLLLHPISLGSLVKTIYNATSRKEIGKKTCYLNEVNFTLLNS